MKSLVDDMASAGKKLDDEELCSYRLAGLDYKYNSFVSSIAAKVKPVTLGELYSQLLAFENRLQIQNRAHQQQFSAQLSGQMHSSVNSASQGWGGFSRGHDGRNSRGGNNSGDWGRGDFSKNKNNFPPCQFSRRTNQHVFKWYKRFDQTYMGEERSANSANSYGVDSNWYADFGATDHIIGELDKLAVRKTYNGLGMHIK
jgi:hypothetical protein